MDPFPSNPPLHESNDGLSADGVQPSPAKLPVTPLERVVAVAIAVIGTVIAVSLGIYMYTSLHDTKATVTSAVQNTGTPAQPQAEDIPQPEEDHSAKAAIIREKSAGMTRQERDRWLRQCFDKLNCKQWHVDAIVEGAPMEERVHANRVSFAASAEKIAGNGVDGTDLSLVPIGILSGILELNDMGLSLLSEMPKTSIAEAKKDPDAARGKVIKASGNVIEIAKFKGFYEGTIATGNGSFVHFVTPLSTDGIYDNSWATFSGIFVQRYAFENVSGGQTKTLMLVGGFDIPANRSR